MSRHLQTTAAKIRDMKNPKVETSALKAAEKKIRSLRNAGVTADLRIAEVLVPILSDWEKYEEEAGSISGPRWAEIVTGNPKGAANAFHKVGAMKNLLQTLSDTQENRNFVRFGLHPASVIYLAGPSIPPNRRKEVLEEVKERVEAVGVVLEHSQVMRIVQKRVGYLTRKAPPGRTRKAVKAFVQTFDQWVVDTIRGVFLGKPLTKPPQPDDAVKDFVSLVETQALYDRLARPAKKSRKKAA